MLSPTKLLDSSSNKNLYRSAVCPADDLHPNKHLLTPKPITFVNPARILTNLSVNPWLNHHGPLENDDPNDNGSPYNEMVEWETGEITEEPLSIITKDDPVTCAAYAKKNNLLDLPE